MEKAIALHQKSLEESAASGGGKCPSARHRSAERVVTARESEIASGARPWKY
jgi:hypothetical protein